MQASSDALKVSVNGPLNAGSAHRPTVVDLFAGAGGFSLGFEQAGFDVVAAVESDPVHAAVHHFNFPQSHMFPVSVADVTGAMIRERVGGRPTVVIGGAPCQGFSLIGKRALDDPRNSLVSEYLRLVGELEPEAIVFENVKGLTLGQHAQFLDELVNSMERMGYHVTLPWRVLNAAHYGVPQNRERLFILGTRRSAEVIPYPLASHGPGSGQALVTCGQALEDLPDADAFPTLLKGDAASIAAWPEPSEYARYLRPIDVDEFVFGVPRKWDVARLTSSTRTRHTTITRSRFMQTPEGETEPISRFHKLHHRGLCNTLRAGTDSSRGAFTSPRPIHYRYPRCVTVREMARLQSFPDWFRFHATKWHGGRQVGNSVPPRLARAIAREVMSHLGYTPTPATGAVPLGDPSLLKLTVRSAAEYFGVPAPERRRNQRSVHRKRSQAEVEADRQSQQLSLSLAEAE